MTNENFYKRLDLNLPRIQRLASELTSDFETARFLYQETTHQAMKNRKDLADDNFDSWLSSTMEAAYFKLSQFRA